MPGTRSLEFIYEHSMWQKIWEKFVCLTLGRLQLFGGKPKFLGFDCQSGFDHGAGQRGADQVTAQYYYSELNFLFTHIII